MHEPTVIFLYGGGRLANQLLNFSHLIAWSAENQNKFNIFSVPFWPYASLFTGTSKNRFCRYPMRYSAHSIADQLYSKAAVKVMNLDPYGSGEKILKVVAQVLKGCGQHLIRIEFPNTVELGCEEFDSCVKARRFSFLGGWGFRNWSLVDKHQEVVRNFFQPEHNFQQTAQSFMQRVRGECDYVIGVLIRQSDYQLWLDGRYFFPTSVYVDWMKEINEWFPGQRIGFVITSDEIQDEQQFDGLKYWFATGAKQSRGHYLESVIELSKCDLIMSPPSTFSAWAAFMGNCPLLTLAEPGRSLDPTMLMHNHIIDARLHPHFSRSVN